MCVNRNNPVIWQEMVNQMSIVFLFMLHNVGIAANHFDSHYVVPMTASCQAASCLSIGCSCPHQMAMMLLNGQAVHRTTSMTKQINRHTNKQGKIMRWGGKKSHLGTC